MYFRVADWLKAIVFAVILFLLYLLAGSVLHTILLFAIASFIVFIINPIIHFLLQRKVPRVLAIIMTYVLFFSLFLLFLLIIGPVIVQESKTFAANLPDYISSLRKQAKAVQTFIQRIGFGGILAISPDTLISEAARVIANQLSNIFGLIPSLINFVTDLFLVLFISIYMLIFLPTIDRFIRFTLPHGQTGLYAKFLTTMRTALARYLLGLLASMTSIGFLAGVAVSILGLPFPALFGLWAGLTEIVPVIGPILGAIPAVIVALTIDPVTALWVVLAFIIIQLLENNILAPFILAGTVGINPLLILFAIVAGGELAGIVGIFLAVPTLVVVTNILRFIRDNFKYERVEGGPDRIIIKQ
ncbi:MAG: AI-2E family transporter [Firmicutes bacterium]|nr:AI-2E family transporter [Bacillota bacterium]